MARGPSGRVVIEMDPDLKRELHAALVADGNTLKDWFIAQAERFLAERNQPGLPGLAEFPASIDQPSALVAEDSAPYQATPKSSPSDSTSDTDTDS